MTVQQVLPLTLVGYAAAMVVSHIDPGTGSYIAMPILYMGIAIQGMGILVSLLVGSNYRTSHHPANTNISLSTSPGLSTASTDTPSQRSPPELQCSCPLGLPPSLPSPSHCSQINVYGISPALEPRPTTRSTLSAVLQCTTFRSSSHSCSGGYRYGSSSSRRLAI